MLYTLTGVYFRGGDEAIGERNLCITFGGVYFLLSMVILIVNDRFLEFGLNTAYESFNRTATRFLQAHEIEHASLGPASKIMFQFWLAIWSGMIGLFFTFPGLRYSQMHRDALFFNRGSRFMMIALRWDFIGPLLTLLLWVRPLARTPLCERAYAWYGGETLMAPENFEILRILIVLMTLLVRLSLMPLYLQAYLDLALVKLVHLKKQSGKIKNIELQKMVG